MGSGVVVERSRVVRDFVVKAFLRVVAVGALLFLLLRVVAPALISAHDTLMLWLGVAVLLACPLILFQFVYAFARSWAAFRRALNDGRHIKVGYTP